MEDLLRQAIQQSQDLILQARKLMDDYPMFYEVFDKFIKEQIHYQTKLNQEIIKIEEQS